MLYTVIVIAPVIGYSISTYTNQAEAFEIARQGKLTNSLVRVFIIDPFGNNQEVFG